MAVRMFTAPWCGPCRQLKPVLQQQCLLHDVPLTMLDIETSEGREEADACEVTALPTTIFVAADGLVSERKVGSVTERDISACLQKISAKKPPLDDEACVWTSARNQFAPTRQARR